MTIPLSVLSTGNLKYLPYEDATYKYHCLAAPGTAAATEAWQVRRETSATGAVDFASGSAEFNVAVTDLATVQSYDYS